MGNVVKVGMADLNICKSPDVITTLGLGSCIGLRQKQTNLSWNVYYIINYEQYLLMKTEVQQRKLDKQQEEIEELKKQIQEIKEGLKK